MRRRRWMALALGGVALAVSAEAYDLETHARLTELAARTNRVGFSLTTHLQTLGLAAGVDANLMDATGTTRSVVQWMRQGAMDEDAPLCRTARHFHLGLSSFPWDTGGLSLPPLLDRPQDQLIRFHCKAPTYLSSARWMQTPSAQTDVGGGDWSWKRLRQSLLEALTRPTKAQRDAKWVEVFIGLGHVMHLAQDATVPAHSRNDTHITEEPFEFWLEAWVKGDLPGKTLADFDAVATAPFPFDPTNFQQPVSEPAPLPATRVLDTDRYNGSNPGVTPLGCAEYSHTHFVSHGTLFTRYPHPSEAEVAFTRRAIPPEVLRGTDYFKRLSPPLVKHFVAGRMRWVDPRTGDPIPGRASYTVSDPLVMRDHAQHLLPLAVTCGAAMVQQFFRGSFVVQQLPTVGRPPTIVVVTIQNTGLERLTGRVSLWWDGLDNLRHFVGAPVQTIDLLPGASTPPFDIPLLLPLGTVGAQPILALFTGTQGTETGSVVASTTVLGSPQPGEVCFALPGAERSCTLIARINGPGSMTVEGRASGLIAGALGGQPTPIGSIVTGFWAGGAVTVFAGEIGTSAVKFVFQAVLEPGKGYACITKTQTSSPVTGGGSDFVPGFCPP